MSSTVLASGKSGTNQNVLLKGIRHLSSHESVLCVIHVDKDSLSDSTEREEELQLNETKKKKNRKFKSVSFRDTDITSECSIKDGLSSSSSSLSSDDGIHNMQSSSSKTQSKTNSLSPQRRNKAKLKTSPLIADITHEDSDNGSNASSPSTSRRSLNFLGLSPVPKRKGNIRSPSFDQQSLYSNSTTKQSMSSKETSSKTPLDSGFIGSDEELQNLRFIKHALSGASVPISPELFRKRSNTVDASDNIKRVNPPLENFRARVATLDSTKGLNKSKVNGVLSKTKNRTGHLQ